MRLEFLVSSFLLPIAMASRAAAPAPRIQRLQPSVVAQVRL
jgi:hypothetical protein